VEVFEAIAQPTRRRILRLLAAGERTVSDVASEFDVTQPAISQHLKVLREAGLVADRRDGVRRVYSLRPEGLGDLQGFLAEVLPASLDRLAEVVEEDERRGRGHRARRN
jgi:DNA-binding transcriptional ArsR family regulator